VVSSVGGGAGGLAGSSTLVLCFVVSLPEAFFWPLDVLHPKRKKPESKSVFDNIVFGLMLFFNEGVLQLCIWVGYVFGVVSSK
jgi:hypothetical protein